MLKSLKYVLDMFTFSHLFVDPSIYPNSWLPDGVVMEQSDKLDRVDDPLDSVTHPSVPELLIALRTCPDVPTAIGRVRTRCS